MYFILEFKNKADGTFKVHHNLILENGQPQSHPYSYGWKPVCMFKGDVEVEKLTYLIEEYSNGDIDKAMKMAEVLWENHVPIKPWSLVEKK